MLACLKAPRGRSRPSQYLLPTVTLDLSGLRAVELIGIRCGHVDLARDRIWIDKTKRGTNGRRFIPITRELGPVIDVLDPASRPVDEPLFVIVDRHGLRRPLTENGLYKAQMRASEAAGLASTIGNHDLRHRYMSRLILAGVPLPMIRDVVGHSNLTSLERVYSHVLPNEPTAPLESLREDINPVLRRGTEPSHHMRCTLKSRPRRAVARGRLFWPAWRGCGVFAPVRAEVETRDPRRTGTRSPTRPQLLRPVGLNAVSAG